MMYHDDAIMYQNTIMYHEVSIISNIEILYTNYKITKTFLTTKLLQCENAISPKKISFKFSFSIITFNSVFKIHVFVLQTIIF